MQSSQPVSVATPIAPTYGYLVGRDREGRWLGVETHGFGGGLFASRAAALHYARGETDRRPGAVVIALEPIALD